jgi:phage baseplate assembly protein W
MDLAHWYGGDLARTPAGDLATVTGTLEGEQRVLRRILTLQGNYIWQPDYGGAVPALIGSLAQPAQIEAELRVQMLYEAVVAQVPPATVQVKAAGSGAQAVAIRYVDAATGGPGLLSFQVQ